MTFEQIDRQIDAQTAKFVSLDNYVADFGVMTAAFIDGEFVLVTEYPLGHKDDYALVQEAAEAFLAAGEIINTITK